MAIHRMLWIQSRHGERIVLCGSCSWSLPFLLQRLEMVTQRLSEDEFKAAREPKNAHKNRFSDVLPRK